MPAIDDDHHDELPADLDAAGYVGPYTFPDIVRRRIAGVLYIVTSAVCGLLWVTHRDGAVLVNGGLGVAAIALVLIGVYHFIAGFHLKVTDTDALVAATKRVGFPVGHASAQLGWRGLASRPTWRILLYSAEDPPERRGLVLVDGVDATIIGEYVEQNPEDWSQLTR